MADNQGIYHNHGNIQINEAIEGSAKDIAQGLSDIGVTEQTIYGTLDRVITNLTPKRDVLVEGDRNYFEKEIDKFFKENLLKNPEYTSITDQNARDEKRKELYYKKLETLQNPDTKNYYIARRDPNEPEDFKVTTKDVDRDIKDVSGPQVVCPMWMPDTPKGEPLDARFALNAVKGRWGSTFAALYGDGSYRDLEGNDKNIIDTKDGKEFRRDAKGEPLYNSVRGKAVFQKVDAELDKAFELANGQKHANVDQYTLEGDQRKTLVAVMKDGSKVGLKEPSKFAGYSGDVNAAGDPIAPSGKTASIVLASNGMHMELKINRSDTKTQMGNCGQEHHAGIEDIQQEGAITTILDMEDSVAAVNAEDKAHVYKNWNGIMRGDIKQEFTKDGKKEVRELEHDLDKHFMSANGGRLDLKGRSTILVRTVGMAMKTDAVKTLDGKEVPEHLVDLVMTSYAALHDLKKAKDDPSKNSKENSVYIVIPKLHGPEEVKYIVEAFKMMEAEMSKATGQDYSGVLKLALMDEEQRTSLNLKECIRAAQDRIVFINTGFLDRTGDLIHTAMQAGAIADKATLNTGKWYTAYEKNNVFQGLKAWLHKVGQIGKGMWTQNRNPQGLFNDSSLRHNHTVWGGKASWVPSPVLGIIDALRFMKHSIDKALENIRNEPAPDVKEIVNIPLISQERVDKIKAGEKDEKFEAALESYCQSILGYVVRWVNDGVGCSSVPDASGAYLMEDRATLRIHSQILANWKEMEILNDKKLEKFMNKAAETVDKQNMRTPDDKKYYIPLKDSQNGPAFQCAMELVNNGLNAKNGYVEDSLHKFRRKVVDKDREIANDNAETYFSEDVPERIRLMQRRDARMGEGRSIAA